MKASLDCEICILAGGLSARMKRDKARLRLGRHTLLGHVCNTARQLGLPVRLIRRDLVPRCGPLGGIYTAFRTYRADAQLFLACDMPFASAEWLEQLRAYFEVHRKAVFTSVQGCAGFPFLLPRESLAVVRKQMARREFSLQKLARALRAGRLRPLPKRLGEFCNVNTPEEWAAARRRWRKWSSAS